MLAVKTYGTVQNIKVYSILSPSRSSPLFWRPPFSYYWGKKKKTCDSSVVLCQARKKLRATPLLQIYARVVGIKRVQKLFFQENKHLQVKTNSAIITVLHHGQTWQLLEAPLAPLLCTVVHYMKSVANQWIRSGLSGRERGGGRNVFWKSKTGSRERIKKEGKVENKNKLPNLPTSALRLQQQ